MGAVGEISTGGERWAPEASGGDGVVPVESRKGDFKMKENNNQPAATVAST